MGIGIGMIITSTFILGYNYKQELSDAKIEEKARGLGMIYEDECKVILKGDEKN